VRACTVTEEEDIPGLLLKLIGQAWDTMGTNELTYDVLRQLYEYAINKTKLTPRQIYEIWKTDASKAKFLASMAKKSYYRREGIF